MSKREVDRMRIAQQQLLLRQRAEAKEIVDGLSKVFEALRQLHLRIEERS